MDSLGAELGPGLTAVGKTKFKEKGRTGRAIDASSGASEERRASTERDRARNTSAAGAPLRDPARLSKPPALGCFGEVCCRRRDGRTCLEFVCWTGAHLYAGRWQAVKLVRRDRTGGRRTTRGAAEGEMSRIPSP